MVSGAVCRISGIWSTAPWQVEQPTPFGDVNGVIEIDVVGQPLTLFQWIGLSSARLARTGASIVRLRIELRMAGHAGMGRRQAGERRGLDRGVAVAAIEAKAADMMLVAERHRLIEVMVGR